VKLWNSSSSNDSGVKDFQIFDDEIQICEGFLPENFGDIFHLEYPTFCSLPSELKNDDIIYEGNCPLIRAENLTFEIYEEYCDYYVKFGSIEIFDENFKNRCASLH
jgi:hypothetical protein